ncbi:MAG: succinate dehydrogenase cytochrome b subunit [Acidimicrobiia bacterium]|nr:MAG: succinate dehydrogenase cytochrome b subunit [Acidimicrobiia bacterium]
MTATKRAPVHDRQGWRQWLGGFFSSSVGLKWLMALTGIGLLLYILAHLIGNLKIFLGVDPITGEYQIDLYSEALRTLGGHLVPRSSILALFRIGLASLFILHIWASVILTRRNWAARGRDRYEAKRQYDEANYASRTMRFSGTIVLLFLLYHLADLTFGYANPEYVFGDVYNNMIASMSQPIVALIYMLANVFLAVHIYHGAWSLFQSLGTANPKYNDLRRYFAVAFAAVILVGNISIPLAILAGWVS